MLCCTVSLPLIFAVLCTYFMVKHPRNQTKRTMRKQSVIHFLSIHHHFSHIHYLLFCSVHCIEDQWSDKTKRYKRIIDLDEEDYGELGSGSFGPVFKMMDQKEKMIVAVKKVELNKLKDLQLNPRQILQKITTGMKVMRECKHVNILKLLDDYKVAGPKGKTIYVVTEYCKGGNLRDYMLANGGPLTQTVARNFSKQTRDALLHLKSKGITHRRLCPEKILLSEQSGNAIVKIGGFIFSQFKMEDSVTAHQTGIGQNNYSAPEMLKKDGVSTPDAYRSNGNVLSLSSF